MIREILSVRERNAPPPAPEQDISPLESVARAMQRQDLLGREGQERKQRCGKRHAHHVPKVRAHGDRDILECVPRYLAVPRVTQPSPKAVSSAVNENGWPFSQPFRIRDQRKLLDRPAGPRRGCPIDFGIRTPAIVAVTLL